jgi:hypothetical protein
MATTTVAILKVHKGCPNGNNFDDGETIEADSFIDAQLGMWALRGVAIEDGFDMMHETPSEIAMNRLNECGGWDELYVRLFLEASN